jgi:hypothetical protein
MIAEKTGSADQAATGVAPATPGDGSHQDSSEEWLLLRVGNVPKTSIGWFRCGVGFYNKKDYTRSIECFHKSIAIDPLNVNV